MRQGPREPARAPPPEYHRADQRPGETPSARLRWLFARLSHSQSTIRGITGEAGADAARSAGCIQQQGIRCTQRPALIRCEALAAHDHRAFETSAKPVQIRREALYAHGRRSFQGTREASWRAMQSTLGKLREIQRSFARPVWPPRTCFAIPSSLRTVQHTAWLANAHA